MVDIKKIQHLVSEELIEANAENPMFHSEHEAYAVIKEELEEAEYEMEKAKEHLERMWILVKRDSNCLEQVDMLKGRIISLIQEAIQVAAMCDKTFASTRK